MKKILCLSLFLFFLTSVVFAGTVNLPKTGQTKCWDTNGTEIPCADTGQDGEIQAGVEWPNPRFTMNGDCVTDKLTGLMWARDGNISNTSKTWSSAIDYCNNLSLCGYDDWRLPNVNELETLVNGAEANTATWLNNQGFNNVQSYSYWSSTTYASSTNNAWKVNMYFGSVYYSSKSDNLYVWPVRSGDVTSAPAPVKKTGQTISYRTGDDGDLEQGVAWPSPRFADNGDTVTDKLTGLMWTKNANLLDSYIIWQEALDYVKGMNNGAYENFGFTDWRLPNRKELHSLADSSKYNPALPSEHPFTNVQSDFYWSSTTYASSTDGAWAVNMSSGFVAFSYKSSYSYYVWPVRSGQCTTWSDVIAKYQAYVDSQALWDDVIECYNQYATP